MYAYPSLFHPSFYSAIFIYAMLANEELVVANICRLPLISAVLYRTKMIRWLVFYKHIDGNT